MKSLFLTAACALALFSARAQPASGGPAPGNPAAPDPTATPLDGGASLLLASGIALGLKKLRNRRKLAR
ncbi:hypothetical protein Q5H92_21700 [Hymenobacter sp. M29]|uniref:VPDSG-CTERM protein sorting domain-containing protein n=1 Tax=Hymenobacter mellowenesis TaxID=3063995 RepID=A0ABT9AGM8_9BACT|nr:hypothetical protein [Hymenobacter sp. M29]MDO7848994.1 hypothetical protein [Hymenobacter sp. M29]